MVYKDKNKEKEYHRKYRQKNKEKRNEYDKKYYQEHKIDILKQQKEYSQIPEVKERKNNYAKEYEKKPEVKERRRKNGQKWRMKNKDKVKKYKLRHREKYPKHVKARNMANTHLQHLKKPGYEFHHPDYNDPLNVIIMPIAEHRALHAQLKNQK